MGTVPTNMEMHKMQLKINPVKSVPGGNRYCGPAVVSSILNVDTKTSAFLLRYRNNRKKITGTAPDWIKNVFNDCNINMDLIESYGRYGKRFTGTWRKPPTLNQWLEKMLPTMIETNNVYLLIARNHWQLVQGTNYVCGQTKDIVPLDDPRVKRRAQVNAVYLLTYVGD